MRYFSSSKMNSSCVKIWDLKSDNSKVRCKCMPIITLLIKQKVKKYGPMKIFTQNTLQKVRKNMEQ